MEWLGLVQVMDRWWELVSRVVGSGLSYGQVVGTGECGNEISGSIKCGEFLD
jgi:hypothetical protein